MLKARKALVVMAVAAGLAVATASGSTNTATKTGSNGSTPSSDAGSSSGAPSATFAVGDQVKLGDWTIVVNGVTVPYTSPNQFTQPAAGNQYVTVDTSVTNNGSKAQGVSSLACFKLVDSTGQSYSETIVVGAPAAPDGEAAPGETVRGTLAYEVPTTATGLALKFKCDLFSSGSATVSLGI